MNLIVTHPAQSVGAIAQVVNPTGDGMSAAELSEFLAPLVIRVSSSYFSRVVNLICAHTRFLCLTLACCMSDRTSSSPRELFSELHSVLPFALMPLS